MLGKKIPTLLALVMLLASVLGGFYWIKNTVPKVSEDERPTQIKITNIADNKFSVSWTTKAPSQGKIEYGLVGEKITLLKGDDRGDNYRGSTHHVSVVNLQPNTQYAFRILVNENARFDNNGTPYAVNTASIINEIPAARSLYGQIEGADENAIVYLSLPGAVPYSSLVKNNGSYSIPISTIRSSDLKQYVSYDPAATIIGLTVDNGLKSSQITVTTQNINPVPTFTLGETKDFRSQIDNAEPVRIAQVEPLQQTPPPTSEQTAAPLNIEPLQNQVNLVESSSYTIGYPAVDGEVISTTKPEFRGTGVKNEVITLAVSGQKSVTDSIRVDAAGNWKWTPALALAIGKQKIVLSYKDSNNVSKTIERSFSISNSSAVAVPAFVASPSASIKASPISNPVISTAAASPRVVMPDTDTEVPTTGVMTPLLLTGAIGFAIVIIGAYLLVL
ncbi:MAG: hypothetical protein E6Q84_01015 [Thiothrix sp.]|nr:MAG: hypothetical protein E6Q84_01015 [Thiothrix sp.]